MHHNSFACHASLYADSVAARISMRSLGGAQGARTHRVTGEWSACKHARQSSITSCDRAQRPFIPQLGGFAYQGRRCHHRARGSGPAGRQSGMVRWRQQLRVGRGRGAASAGPPPPASSLGWPGSTTGNRGACIRGRPTVANAPLAQSRRLQQAVLIPLRHAAHQLQLCLTSSPHTSRYCSACS